MIIISLKSRLQILEARSVAKTVFSGKYMLMYMTPTLEKNLGPNNIYRAKEFVRFLPVITKKIHKNAVIRNRIKRQLREAFRLINKEFLKNKHDYQFLTKKNILNASFNDIKKDVEDCLTFKVLEKENRAIF
jgi:ribonuclease P protein component